MSRHIAIFTDDPGWHGAKLHQAFSKKGFDCTNVSLTDCQIEIGASKQRLLIPGFENKLPDAAFVRGVPGGSLEEVVFYLDILHALQEMNILVYNDAKAIERSVDKGMTSFLLDYAGIPTPPTCVSNNAHQAYAFIRDQLQQGYKVVAKPLFGSQGKNLQLISKPDDIIDFTVYKNIYYLQRFIETGIETSHDWRLFVIANNVIASMRREGADWISNIANGGTSHPAVLDNLFMKISIDAISAVRMFYGGVDIMQDLNGKLWVTEVNSIPAWKGLQSVNKINVAENLVENFIDCLQNKQGIDVAG